MYVSGVLLHEVHGADGPVADELHEANSGIRFGELPKLGLEGPAGPAEGESDL